MRQTIHRVHHYKGLHGGEAKCRLYVYQDDEKTVAIFSEMEENKGTSITNRIEHLATEIWESLSRPANFTVFEMYREGLRDPKRSTFDQEEITRVEFTLTDHGYRTPRWHYVTRKDVEAILACPLGAG